jgi:hypothetical protein
VTRVDDWNSVARLRRIIQKYGYTYENKTVLKADGTGVAKETPKKATTTEKGKGKAKTTSASKSKKRRLESEIDVEIDGGENGEGECEVKVEED